MVCIVCFDQVGIRFLINGDIYLCKLRKVDDTNGIIGRCPESCLLVERRSALTVQYAHTIVCRL